MMRSRWVAVARGDEPADLVLKGGRVLSVFTGEVFPADVAIADGHVVGVGAYDGTAVHDVSGRILVPGFIDGHCHIESSKLSVDEFARAVLPRGTTSVVIDPHEVANVLGLAGVEYMLAASKSVPLGVYVMMPSCVPASQFETSAVSLEAYDFPDMLARQRILGIAELMNYPGAIAGDPGIMSKMATAGYRHVDGHAPGVRGKALNAYIASGPSSDHECAGLEEALEKKRLGMWIMIREASMIRNLVDLLPLVTEYGTENCMFVTDDREASTLLEEGHINSMVRKAVEHGLPAPDAVKLATLNTARYHGLEGQGAVAPGYRADILVLPDLVSFEPLAVYRGGEVVAEGGRSLPFTSTPVPPEVTGTVHIDVLPPDAFRIPYEGWNQIRVIDLIPDQVVTRATTDRPAVRQGEVVADPDRDLVKLAVVERHRRTGNIGLGFVRGFGLREGAMASTVAHDSHNIVAAGVNDRDMIRAVERLAEIGGGLVVVRNGEIAGELPLEIAGLMSARSADEVVAGLELLERVLQEMGVGLATPFMYLGFLALSVIPEMRVTDQGIVDVRSFELVPLGLS
jgi:adenine deaminase